MKLLLIMKQRIMSLSSLLGVILALFVLNTVASAESLDSIHLLKISPSDSRAVVKMEDGSMKIIKPGDVIGKNGKVIEITAGRVVIEELTDSDKETVIIRLEDGKQTIERLRRTPDRRPEGEADREGRQLAL